MQGGLTMSDRNFLMRFSIAALALSLVTSSELAAQTTAGSISGQVTDPSGAIIPRAPVTLTDEGKGYLFHATTDSSGRYLFRQVAPGSV